MPKAVKQSEGIPARLSVKLRSPALTLLAVRNPDSGSVEIDGRPVRTFPDDYQIFKGDRLIDVVSPRTFVQQYEPVDAGGLRVSPEQQQAIGQALGQDAAESADRLVTTVQRLARLNIGQVEVNWSPAQWEEIARRAEKRGKKVATYVQQMVDKLLQDVWTNAGI